MLLFLFLLEVLSLFFIAKSKPEYLKLVLGGRYLVTTLKIVPRGTEGAVSAEGTSAGLLASILLAFVGCLMGQVLLILSLYTHTHTYRTYSM